MYSRKRRETKNIVKDVHCNGDLQPFTRQELNPIKPTRPLGRTGGSVNNQRL